jgi:peptidyl-prolyl cis-trans isomerase D
MLNNIRNFSKTIFAKILLIIIIIPFIFWGMGGVFNSGNSNNIVKINDHNISTQDFINYLNNLNIDSNTIKENVDNNVEELLTGLISNTLLDMEIKDLGITISEKSLANKIRKNKNFLDDKNFFSRTKYEKFLLKQNLTASSFETKLKNSELKKKLFAYVSGGIVSPFFLVNNFYKNQTEQLKLDFIDIEKVYKLKDNFTKNEVENFINKNSEELKEDYIDFSYIKINPKILLGENEYTDLFFEKIDLIETNISEGKNIESIAESFKLKPTLKKNYVLTKDSSDVEKIIYKNRNGDNIQLIDESKFYILFEIKKISKILPDLNNLAFKNKLKTILYNKNKYEYNKDLLQKIENKKFKQNDFKKFAADNSLEIKSITLNSINDDKIFDINSIKLLYALPKNTIALVNDKNNKIYIANVKKFYNENLDPKSETLLKYRNQTNIKMRNNMYSSYDYFLNEKYKIIINQKTLDRVKNYFR